MLLLLSYHILLEHYLLKQIFHHQYLKIFKPLQITTSIVFNLVSASNTISSCFFFFFFITDLYFLIPAIIMQIFIVIAELAIPARIPTKEARAENETQQITVEARIIKCSV